MLLRKIKESVREKSSLFVWLFDICGLQFEIVREVCCCLVLVLRFSDLLYLGVLQLLDLLCGSLFGFVFVRESYLGVFEIWVCKRDSTLICTITNLL